MTKLGCVDDMFMGRVVERCLPQGSNVKMFLKTPPDSSGYYECYVLVQHNGHKIYAPSFISGDCEDPLEHITAKVSAWVETFMSHVSHGNWEGARSVFVGVSLRVKYHHVKADINARWPSHLFKRTIASCANDFIAKNGGNAGFLEVYEYCMDNFMKFVGKEEEWGLT